MVDGMAAEAMETLVKWRFLSGLSDGIRGWEKSTGSIVVASHPITSVFSDPNRCEMVIPQ
jgi:hypothetical protein